VQLFRPKVCCIGGTQAAFLDMLGQRTSLVMLVSMIFDQCYVILCGPLDHSITAICKNDGSKAKIERRYIYDGFRKNLS
jgi:hypothetical protein